MKNKTNPTTGKLFRMHTDFPGACAKNPNKMLTEELRKRGT